ncbi:MAG: ABC transporter ATP-binding protein, partial [Gemmatimonadales bacterium]
METLLTAENLTKHYKDVVALDGVSFGISDGITGILGENGAGKSTAIKIFLGLLRPTSGTATVLGENASESIAVRSRLGYMPEHDCLPTGVTAAEFLTHMAEVSGLPPSRARTRAADTLRHAGLFEERYRAMGGYSTGMKQRVKLAQALVHDPTMVFLDEPTAGLDPRSRNELWNVIRDLVRGGTTVLLTTQYLEEADQLADRIAVIDRGSIIADGTPSQLKRRAGSEFISVQAAEPEQLD